VLIKKGATDFLRKDRLARLGQPVARALGKLKIRAEKRQAEVSSRGIDGLFRRLAENSQIIVFCYRLTPPPGFEYVSPAAAAISGYTPEELYADPDLGRRIVHPDDRGVWEQPLDSGGPIALRWLRKDGAVIWIEQRNVPIYDEAGKLIAIEGIALDITERKHLESQLGHLANHDPLTDLFNRRHFQEELERHFAQARRYGSHAALLFLDLDNLKNVNDSLGHRAGDALLVSLAGLLRERLRETDIVARLGGDEFAILLPRADRDQARAVGEQLREAVQHHRILISGQPIGVTASIGIVLIPRHGTTVGEVFARADLATYKAKENGRNCLAVYRPDKDWQAKAESRLGWHQRIREAVEKDLFLLTAQPILHLGSNQISQYELLLRMVGEGGAIVHPGAFLDMAERFGEIQAIDRQVVRRAIQLIAERHRAGRELRLEVNLSSKAFADRELLPMIEHELAATAIPPSSLVLEVTETAAIANIHQAERFVRTLKALGCQFALDDFGVGFSSFYRLKHLPVDYLKIDGSFIRNLPHDPLNQHLVKAIVEVARGLGIWTIAEWVGDEETVNMLREYGAGYAQGFHIGRPRALRSVPLFCQLSVPGRSLSSC